MYSIRRKRSCDVAFNTKNSSYVLTRTHPKRHARGIQKSNWYTAPQNRLGISSFSKIPAIKQFTQSKGRQTSRNNNKNDREWIDGFHPQISARKTFRVKQRQKKGPNLKNFSQDTSPKQSINKQRRRKAGKNFSELIDEPNRDAKGSAHSTNRVQTGTHQRKSGNIRQPSKYWPQMQLLRTSPTDKRKSQMLQTESCY